MKTVSEEGLHEKGKVKHQYKIFIKLCELLRKTEYLSGLELRLKNQETLTAEEIRKIQELLEESGKSPEIISSFSLFYEKDEDFQVVEKNEEFFQPFINKDLETIQTLFVTRLNELES